MQNQKRGLAETYVVMGSRRLEKLALGLAQRVDQLPEIEERDHLERQDHDVGHRPQEEGAQLPGQQRGDMSHGQFASTSTWGRLSLVTASTNRSSSELRRSSRLRSGQPPEVSFWQTVSRRSAPPWVWISNAAMPSVAAGDRHPPHAVDGQQEAANGLGRASGLHQDRLVLPQVVELVVDGDPALGDDDDPAAHRLDLGHDVG